MNNVMNRYTSKWCFATVLSARERFVLRVGELKRRLQEKRQKSVRHARPNCQLTTTKIENYISVKVIANAFKTLPINQCAVHRNNQFCYRDIISPCVRLNLSCLPHDRYRLVPRGRWCNNIILDFFSFLNLKSQIFQHGH